MPVADHATYCRMLAHARTHKFAYPAINITSTSTINAALNIQTGSKATAMPLSSGLATRSGGRITVLGCIERLMREAGLR